ncbi:two-component system, NarL family, sensor histidine kinase [Methylomarinovum caldicuralii]|uniref:Oxygen sensor histidine kinase NreB n=1 Tax=Methylomarinovum caldicuralii TaxID=438856 RepID=A0AAU9CF55_9GAMM|nr:histidine kinase [Methylomarinovum caldicuralii]BCX81650.1 two-component system, NarL family, sensor histidine kinase [Methylomarinovum caldicuralii]
MIPLYARDALLPRIRQVSAEARPCADGDPCTGLYAVFSSDQPQHFLGVVSAKQVAERPHRIFADLMSRRFPCVVAADTPLEAILDCMDMTEHWYFPVLDDLGGFLGVVTRARILEVLLRSHNSLLAQNRSLMRQMFAVQEQERRYLARELHDEMGQYLSALQTDLGCLRQLGRGQQRLERQIEVITEELVHLQQTVRRIMQRLRPEPLDQLGLEATLRELVTEYQNRHPDVNLTLEIAGDLQNLPDEYAITLYRVVQEGLTNVIRHAGAHSVRVCLCRRQRCSHPVCQAYFAASGWKREQVHLLLCDDGCGFRQPQGGGLGILGMQERVEVLGGRFRIRGRPGGGTHVVVELPLPEGE